MVEQAQFLAVVVTRKGRYRVALVPVNSNDATGWAEQERAPFEASSHQEAAAFIATLSERYWSVASPPARRLSK